MTTFPPELWRRASVLFEAALGQPEAERAEFVRQVSGPSEASRLRYCQAARFAACRHGQVHPAVGGFGGMKKQLPEPAGGLHAEQMHLSEASAGFPGARAHMTLTPGDFPGGLNRLSPSAGDFP